MDNKTGNDAILLDHFIRLSVDVEGILSFCLFARIWRRVATLIEDMSKKDARGWHLALYVSI